MTTFFRLVLVVPIAIVLGLLGSGASRTAYGQGGQAVSATSGSVAGGLVAATALMIVVQQHYPRWWFDFALELARFSMRVGACECRPTRRGWSPTDTRRSR